MLVFKLVFFSSFVLTMKWKNNTLKLLESERVLNFNPETFFCNKKLEDNGLFHDFNQKKTNCMRTST